MVFLCNCLVKLARNGSDESDISVETDSQGLLSASSAYVELSEHIKLSIYFSCSIPDQRSFAFQPSFIV